MYTLIQIRICTKYHMNKASIDSKMSNIRRPLLPTLSDRAELCFFNFYSAFRNYVDDHLELLFNKQHDHLIHLDLGKCPSESGSNHLRLQLRRTLHISLINLRFLSLSRISLNKECNYIQTKGVKILSKVHAPVLTTLSLS